MTCATRNPFTLMLEPEVVLAAIARSEHVARFERRICRPLDRPGELRFDEPTGVDDDPRSSLQ